MAELTEPDVIRERVRETYAAAAGATAPASCCGPAAAPLTGASGTHVFGDALYDAGEAAASAGAVGASLGCGVPTAVADRHAGETVLDLGSGASVLIGARRVGANGRVVGLDMIDEMLALARTNAERAGPAIVRARKPAAGACCAPAAKPACCGAAAAAAPASCGCQAPRSAA